MKRIIMIGLVVLGLLFSVSNVCHAVPALQDTYSIEQPDGNTFKVKMKGDEWNNWIETADGYTIEKDSNGFWKYVARYAGKKALLDKLYADRIPPRGLKKHIRPSGYYLNPRAANESSAETLQTAPYGPFTGNVLFILAEFSDRAGTYSEASFASFISDNISDYFYEASYGNATLAPANETFGAANNGVVGWVNLGYNHPNTGSNTDIRNQQITINAINAADPYVNFADYDTNHDNYVDSDELAVVVIVAGYERSYSSAYSPSVWGHKWSCNNPPVVDGVKVCDYHSDKGGYVQFGEIHQSSAADGHQATMGIMVHELGHLIFGLPDLYDTDYSSSGIGVFGIMSGGSWGKSTSDVYYGDTPVLPCAWTKYNLGWVEAYEGSGTETMTAAGSASADSLNTVYRASTGLANEYFLIENRQPVGYDRGMEATLGSGFGGIAIWHVDENQSANSNDSHRKVDIEEADGTVMGTGSGSATDLWYSGNAVTFDTLSNPNSNLYSGSPSNVSIFDISASGSTMTASFGAVSAPITQTITPPAVTTVAPGDVLGPFAIAYTNNTSALYQFYLQEYVIGSNGNVRWWPPSGKWLLGDATRNVNKRFRARSWRSEERRVGKECRSRWSTYH